MTKIIGIDDAGRGPVLGPMILAGVLIDSEAEEKILKDWGAKDSKLLLPKKRAEIAEKIRENYAYHIESSTPKEIDSHSNLNWLEAEKAAKIIIDLTKDSNKKLKIIIDCPSVNCKAWQDYLVQKIPKEILEKIESISAEHKADFNHPVVSAASIIAKEKREEEVRKIKTEFGDIGSGYPSDPKTKEFIAENFNNPKHKEIIRFSWSTVKKLINEKERGQKKLF
jgi:ribonuclease HII